jgi:hypothetical protein
MLKELVEPLRENVAGHCSEEVGVSFYLMMAMS